MREQKSLPPHQEPSYVKITSYSLIAHIVVVFIAIGLPEITKQSARTLYPTVRVDLVALPEKRPFEMKPSPISPPKEISKPKTEPIKKETQPKKVVLEDKRLKKIVTETQKKTSSKNNADMDKAIGDIAKLKKQEDEVEGELIRGNVKSESGTAKGSKNGEARHPYYDYVESKIRSEWRLPPWAAEQKLKATVKIFINSAGEVTGITFERRSGDEEFDSSVRETIKNASPFASPPEDIASEVNRKGIGLRFPEE